MLLIHTLVSVLSVSSDIVLTIILSVLRSKPAVGWKRLPCTVLHEPVYATLSSDNAP